MGKINEDLKKQRIGERNCNSKNQWFTIINYNSAINIDIKFDNGEIKKGIPYGYFKRGTIALPSQAKEKHGERYTKLWREWNTMLWRCNPKNKRHHIWYSDKGICVCEDWKLYTNFRNWALKNGFKENLTIDRIEETKNYSPSNCRWITLEENVARIEKTSTWIPVNKYDLNGNFIEFFPNLTRAAKTISNKIHSPMNKIKDCCEGKTSEYKGYIWKYENK